MEGLEERRLLSSVTVDASGGSTLNEGSTYTLLLTASVMGSDVLTGWSVDWGDGSSPESLEVVSYPSAAHVYADGPNDFTISATALAYDTSLDVADSDMKTVSLHVDNVDPDTTVSHSSSADEGGLFSAVFQVNSNTGADTLANWTIDWGDGGSDTFAGDPSADGGQTMYHVFADGPATFGVTSTVEDDDGTYTNAAWAVAVFNVSASFAIDAPTTKEGESFTLNIAYNDPGLDDYVTAFHIDWGDGSDADTLPGDAYEAEHMYTDGPTDHTITAIAFATDASHTVTTTVEVDDVAPVWQIDPAPAHTPQNGSVTFHWSGYEDGGADTRSAWTVDWGDGNTATLSASGNDFAHSYSAPGDYTATLAAVDGDGTHEQTMDFNVDDPDSPDSSPGSDLSFDLQTGMLIANYDDDNGDHITDYDETDPLSSADDDLYKMNLYVPSTFTSSDSVTLSSGSVNIYDSPTKDHLLGTGGKVWGDATTVPSVVWIEVMDGSTTVDGMYTSLNGVSQVYYQHNTAVNIKIIADTDPNGDGYDGIEATNAARNWLVGQDVREHVQVDAPAAWTASLTYKWEVEGDILRDYQIEDLYGLRSPVSDDSYAATGVHWGYTQSAIDFFWEQSTVGSVESDTVSIDVGNINGKSLQASSKYGVSTPTVTPTLSSGWEGFNTAGNRIGIYSGTSPDRPGMTFNARVTTPGFSRGDFSYLQLVNPQRRDIRTGPLPTGGGFINSDFGLWGLDNEVTYAGPWSTDGTMRTTYDTPSAGLGAPVIFSSIEDSFRMYIMFRPPGTITRWVPLQVVDWRFNVRAVLIAGTWTLSPGHSAAIGNWETPKKSPEWLVTHTNGSLVHT